VKAGEIEVWRVRLDELREDDVPPPTPGEIARASRFHSEEIGRRYLRAHGALRAILGERPFAVTERGKPYLPNAPEVKFNLSRSDGIALIAVALEVEVGVDVERIRELPEYPEIARRFFPPGEAEPPDQHEFFRRWTRIEARLKAWGVGLYGVGLELDGPWTLEDIDAGEGFAAAVAAMKQGMTVSVRDFGSRG
jgi:4'-phosphopantetheinyl transferase